MARPAKFRTGELLDAASDACRERWRDVGIADVAERAGAPVGSIYHRFASRDALLGAFASVNNEVDVALRQVTSRRYGRLTPRRYRLALLGTRQGPYGLIRPLIGDDIPAEFDAICVAAAEGVLGLGD